MALITLQFSSAHTIIDWFIRLRCNSDISHVDAVTIDGNLLGAQIHEKDGNGVLIRPPNYHKFSRKITIKLNVCQANSCYFIDI